MTRPTRARPLERSTPVGIGLRAPHIDALLGATGGPSWVEVHSENWFAQAGPIAARLDEVGERFDLSLHGVGLSLGSADGISRQHLLKLRSLVDRCKPVLVSEHLSWGAVNGRHSNDLLPMPYHAQSISLLADRIDEVQQFLGRTLLVENVCAYCTFEASTMPEWEFVSRVVERANCGLLLDMNNIHVNAVNQGFDATEYLSAVPWSRVAEIHLAGYETWESMLIDTHGAPVQQPVWQLFEQFSTRLRSDARVLIEWDTNLPTLAVLLEEAWKADRILRPAAYSEAGHA